MNDLKLQERLLRSPNISPNKIVDHSRASKSVMFNRIMLNEENSNKTVDQLKYRVNKQWNSGTAEKHHKCFNSQLIVSVNSIIKNH